jgi:phosphocarrier protein HPr
MNKNAAELPDTEDCRTAASAPEGTLAREFVILNRRGLHARATAKLVQCIEAFVAEVTVSRCGETVGGTSIMGILTLGAGVGSTITITAKGPAAAQVLEAVAALIAENFGEDD